MRLRMYNHIGNIRHEGKRVFGDVDCARIVTRASMDSVMEFERENSDIAPELILGIHRLLGIEGVVEYFREYKFR